MQNSDRPPKHGSKRYRESLWKRLGDLCEQLIGWLDDGPSPPGWEFTDPQWAEAVCCAAVDIAITDFGAQHQPVDGLWCVDQRLWGPLTIAHGVANSAMLEVCLEQLGHGEFWRQLSSTDVLRNLQDVVREIARCDEGRLGVYEQFLAATARGRRRHGVYYTPPALADFIVEHIQQHWPDPAGLLSGWQSPTRHEIRIVDPAAGDCAFVSSVLRAAYRRWKQMRERDTSGSIGSWSEVVHWLAPRLAVNELLPQAALLGQLRVRRTLLELNGQSGNERPLDCVPIPWLVGNALEANHPLNRGTLWGGKRPTLILGNPPYRSSTPMDGGWIERLMRGQMVDGSRASGGPEAASYYEVLGRPLGERKVWLQDIYLRFLRWAQWQLDAAEQAAPASEGAIGFVLNHGLLTNVTFRGVREKLCQSFPQLDVVDLHGNSKAQERTPSGDVDENLFGIATGVAAFMMFRGGGPRRRIADLWGLKSSKEQALASNAVAWQAMAPAAPNYLLATEANQAVAPARYRQAVLLTDLMPLHSTAPVTARDRLVIDSSRATLLERLRAFADPQTPETQLREQYFRRSRSTQYPRGDTRGWKLADARERLRHELAAGDVDAFIRTCLYRPFDWRYVFWARWMVDWPRPKVTRHLHGDNFALIARRQMLPHRPCNYFWATSHIALDGVIRSDNRGSESLFPLWLYGESTGHAPASGCGGGKDAQRRSNFDDRHAEVLCRPLGLQWDPTAGETDAFGDRVGPRDLFGYVYALFQSPGYQREFASSLRREFPRVVAPNGSEAFWQFAEIGWQLLRLHARPIVPGAAPTLRSPGKGWLTLESGAVVRESSWKFQVGAYEPLRKWRQQHGVDKGKPPSDVDLQTHIATLQEIDSRIEATLHHRQALETTWGAAFDW